MRAINVMGALAPLFLASTALAQPYRDDLPAPAYRLLSSMLVEARGSTTLERTGKSIELVAPLVRALDKKYGTAVEASLRRAISARDRPGASAAITTLVLLDAQDLLDGIRRDEFTGWAEGMTRARKAYLDYALVSPELRVRFAELDRRVVAHFGQLGSHLREADMTTFPEEINAARAAVDADLVALRKAVATAPRCAADAGEGR